MASKREMASFFRDEALAELQERLKIGDGLLDVIDLVENQHSAVMAWLFDPREGHGQGDAILRDFLTHVSDQAAKRWSEGVSERADDTQGFMRNWNVQRLQTASLSAAFVVTEFSSTPANRLDLLIVDPENRYLVAVENKIARFRHEQLRRYREYVTALRDDTEWLRSFKLAFVALARDFDPDDEEEYEPDLKEELKHWVPSSYDWLKSGARRAELHIQRGNAAAKLVQDYCQRQTKWQSPNDKECARLVAKIWAAHPAAAAAVASMGRRPQKSWLTGGVDTSEVGDQTQLFAAQNKAIVSALIDGRGFDSVRRRLLENNVHFTEDLVWYGRTWIDVMPRGAKRIYDAEVSDYFPVFLNAYRISESASRVRLHFRPGCIAGKISADRTREVLVGFNPEFSKLQNFNRRVVLRDSIQNDDLPAYMAKLEADLTNRLEEQL